MRLDRHRPRIAALVAACLLAPGFLDRSSDNLANAGGRWLAAVPASFWNGAAWKTGSLGERRAYVLGVTDGLRLAAVFERAGVDLGPVGQCVQQMGPERVTSVVGGHLDSQRVHLDEPTLHFHIWDALVATCLDRIRARK